MAYQGPPSVHNGLLRKNHKMPPPKPSMQRNRSNARSSAAPSQQQPEFNSNVTSGTIRAGSFNATSSKTTATVSNRELTKEEKAAVQETIEENRRKGFFKRIFPSVDFLYYKQFFEEDRPLNRILDERLWAKKRDGTHQQRM